MYHSDLSLRIAQEQREKMVSAVESAAVTLFGVVTGAILPQLVYQYMLAGGELVEPPTFLQYIPHAGYALAVLAFVNMIVRNAFRSRRIQAYRQELDLMGYEDCDCEDCNPAEAESTDSFADALVKAESKAKSKKAPAKKKTASTKKTAKKSAK